LQATRYTEDVTELKTAHATLGARQHPHRPPVYPAVTRTPDIGRSLCRAWAGFDLVAEDEVGAGIAAEWAKIT